MTIRKLENNNFASLLSKIVLIAGVTAGGIFAVNKIIHKKPASTEKVLSAETKKIPAVKNKTNEFVQNIQTAAGDILGEATKIVSNSVSSAASKAEDFVIKTAVDKVMEQVDKMPEKEREKIKEEICK